MINRAILVLLLVLSITTNIYAQKVDLGNCVQYKFNKKIEIPLTIASFAYNFYGFDYLSKTKGLSEEQVLELNIDDIWFFDRWAAKQNPSFKDKAHNISDLFLNVSVVLPAVLALDKKVREQWLDIALMYAELHTINSTFYIGASSIINRSRPIVYNVEAEMSDRTYSGTRNSFYSGHVSTASCASFFAAKVYTDLHPELGNKKYLFFGAAFVPPALVGYFRIRALKHFPSDVLTGFVMGGSLGILVPKLHQVKIKNSDLSFTPLLGNVTGFRLKMQLN